MPEPLEKNSKSLAHCLWPNHWTSTRPSLWHGWECAAVHLGSGLGKPQAWVTDEGRLQPQQSKTGLPEPQQAAARERT